VSIWLAGKAIKFSQPLVTRHDDELFFFFRIRSLFTTAQATSDVNTTWVSTLSNTGLQIHMDGYIGGENTGVWEVCQCLVLDLRVLRGDLVKVGEGVEGNWSREGRSQGSLCL